MYTGSLYTRSTYSNGLSPHSDIIASIWEHG
ncbi:hypothetical protein LOK49_LG02G02894 [Camellia lanceoleosa]|uniref:Uncharacterized protein n=1 Tax=Camellia lanceoleosa TaxID=1840588 RepID=A0ACC0IMP3_9ERIC|nr:hypothetical protein LOK49_LG02G02894 [Camellia lanceoleosa]